MNTNETPRVDEMFNGPPPPGLRPHIVHPDTLADRLDIIIEHIEKEFNVPVVVSVIIAKEGGGPFEFMTHGDIPPEEIAWAGNAIDVFEQAVAAQRAQAGVHPMPAAGAPDMSRLVKLSIDDPRLALLPENVQKTIKEVAAVTGAKFILLEPDALPAIMTTPANDNDAGLDGERPLSDVAMGREDPEKDTEASNDSGSNGPETPKTGDE